MVDGAKEDESGAMSTTAPENPSPAPPSAPLDTGPRITRDDLKNVTRLRRTSGPHRTIGGVAGGVARYLDVDPLIVKVAFVVMALFGGGGLFLYVALWVLLPDDLGSRALIPLDHRSLTFALVGVAVFGAALVLGATTDQWFVWPVVLAGVLAVVLLVRDRRKSSTAVYGPPAGPQAYGATPAYGQVPTESDVPVGDAPAYGPPPPPVSNAPAWTPPPPRPVDPRKRGPVLFWLTLALIALGVGILGMFDVTGTDVVAAAYPALALGITGLMLLVGAFFGRAGGLILLGLLLLPPLAISTAVGSWDGERLVEEPTSAAGVKPLYPLESGVLVLDLTGVKDLKELDGRTIEVTGEVGQLDIRIPERVSVSWEAGVDIGNIRVYGSDSGGLDVTRGGTNAGPRDVAQISLDLQLDVGEIVLDTEALPSLHPLPSINPNGAQE